ncbi:MAG: type II toxin-antitoxin system VapC family toxin [Gammaproteobacteria bacterium]
MRYLLDTNILSEPARKAPDPGVMSRLQTDMALCATAAPVIHELRFGIDRLAPGRRRDRLDSYLKTLLETGLEVLPYDLAAAQIHSQAHARARAELAARGITLPNVDGQIAAIAALHGRVLVTRNVEDFEAFPGLRIENWFGA